MAIANTDEDVMQEAGTGPGRRQTGRTAWPCGGTAGPMCFFEILPFKGQQDIHRRMCFFL